MLDLFSNTAGTVGQKSRLSESREGGCIKLNFCYKKILLRQEQEIIYRPANLAIFELVICNGKNQNFYDKDDFNGRLIYPSN